VMLISVAVQLSLTEIRDCTVGLLLLVLVLLLVLTWPPPTSSFNCRILGQPRVAWSTGTAGDG
jgi:hypothetical protein